MVYNIRKVKPLSEVYFIHDFPRDPILNMDMKTVTSVTSISVMFYSLPRVVEDL